MSTTRKIIEDLAEDLIHLAPLPDNTPLQKIVNRLYLKGRIAGMPAKDVSELINNLLLKHGISKKRLLSNNPTNQ